MNEQESGQETLYKDIYIKVQENLIGELLGKSLDNETKWNLAGHELKVAKESLSEFNSVNQTNETLGSVIETNKSNLSALQTQNNELKTRIRELEVELREVKRDRQLGLEEIHKLKFPQKKRGRPKKIE